MNDLNAAASGRWTEILAKLGGVPAEFLEINTSKETPCPMCGGNTRYRFDDIDGNGTWYCSHCGGKDCKGGGGTGLDLLMRMKGWTFPEAKKQLQNFLGIQQQRSPHKTSWKGVKASGIWWYNPDFCVQRFDYANGEKEIIPQHWTGSQWKWGQPTGTRPLYRLKDIQDRPNAFVLVVEGEKTADAAARLFPKLVVTTWSGGCKACKKTDWSPLKGRKVALWPDADDVGLRAMQTIAGIVEAADIRLVRNPEGVPEGWDIADSGWTSEQAAAWLKANVYELPDLPIALEIKDEPEEESHSKSKQSTAVSAGAIQKYDVHQLCDWIEITYENRIRYNVLLQQIEVDGEPLRNVDRFYIELAYKQVKASRETSVDALAHVADQHPYDPVREYLEQVEREVPPYPIDALATTYLRYNDQPGSLYDRMLEVTLIGAVKRAFEPGCTHQTACVLLGPQGCRKTSFWETLGGEWFDSSLGDLSSKDDLLVLHRSWIQEWGEIDCITGRKHAGQIKAFVSRPIDTYRKPYSRAPESAPRRGIIVGSTNRKEYLLDETGNRRFLTIPVDLPEGQKIDIDSLRMDRDAIWAGAVAAYRAGANNFLTPEEEALAAIDATEYRLDSPWEPVIVNWLDSPDGKSYVYHSKLTTSYLLTNVIQKPIERQTRADQMAVADVMRKLGWEQKRTSKLRYWVELATE